jgi:hypothetical protein
MHLLTIGERLLDNDTLLKNLQQLYDVLLDGSDQHQEFDRLIALSAVGEAVEQLRYYHARDIDWDRSQ